MMESMTTTAPGESRPAWSALDPADRVARRRAARAVALDLVRAASDLDRMATRYGPDAVGHAALAALARENGPTLATGADLAAVVSETVRSAAGTALRSDRDRAARERVAATGIPVRVESRADLAARVAWQYRDLAADGCRVGPALDRVAETAPRRPTSTDATADATARDAALDDLAVAPACSVACRLCAVVAALAADGPTTTSDHDPAGCARVACRKCERARRSPRVASRSAVDANAMPTMVGPLARPGRKRDLDRGRPYRRPGRDLAAPRERTTSRAVELIRETSTAAMLDRTRAAGATTRPGGDPTGASALDGRPTVALDLAILATVTATGRRGVRVAWHEYAAGAGMRAADLAAWQYVTAGYVLAAAITAGTVTYDDLPRMARAAGMSSADLAAAVTDAMAR